MSEFYEAITFDADEGTTPTYQVTLEGVDSDGNVVPIMPADLNTLTLTVREMFSNEIVNEREAQDVLNTNNVEVDDNGVLTWSLVVGDTEILNDILDFEHHRCLFRWTYTTVDGDRVGDHEFWLRLRNLVVA